MNEKQKLLATIGVFLFLAGALGGYGWWQWKKIQETEKQIKRMHAEIAKLSNKIKQIPEMERLRDALSKKITEYEKILPDKKEVEGLMSMLSEQAELAGCKVHDFSLVGGKRRLGMAAGPYRKIRFQCTVTSSREGKGYIAAMTFLNLLERYKRFIAADSFSIAKGGGEGESMQMRLNAHTYMFTGAGPSATGGRRR